MVITVRCLCKPHGSHKTKTYNRNTKDEEKHTTKENHQIANEESKRGRKGLGINRKTINKMSIVSSLLSIAI